MNPTLIAGSDFVSYRTGAEILLGEDRKNLYDISTQAKYQKEELDFLGRKVLPFRNPSPIALLFMPFAFLPEIWAYRLFAIANLAILVFAVQLFGKSIFRKPNQYIYWVALTFWPVISTIITGQISILLLVLFAYMYIFLETNKPFQLGIVSSLLLLKPQYVIFLPFLFLLTNLKGKYLKGLFLGGLMLLLLTVLISGVEFLWRYPKFLMATESPTYGSHIKCYGIFFYAFYFCSLCTKEKSWPTLFKCNYLYSNILYSHLDTRFGLAPNSYVCNFTKNDREICKRKKDFVCVVFNLIFIVSDS